MFSPVSSPLAGICTGWPRMLRVLPTKWRLNLESTDYPKNTKVLQILQLHPLCVVISTGRGDPCSLLTESSCWLHCSPPGRPVWGVSGCSVWWGSRGAEPHRLCPAAVALCPRRTGHPERTPQTAWSLSGHRWSYMGSGLEGWEEDRKWKRHETHRGTETQHQSLLSLLWSYGS